MRVVEVITRGDDMGGAQVHVVHLAERLIADGHEVLVITGAPGVVTDRLDAAGVPRVSIPQLRREIHPRRDISAVIALRREIARFRPDLVACHSSKAGILGRIAARWLGVPVVFTAHGWAFTEGIGRGTRAVYRVLERWFAGLADALICVSEFDRQLAIDAGLPRQALVTIHNGIPDDRCTLARMPVSSRLSVVMVGRFVPQKDQQLLVRAVAGTDDVEAHFVGDGPNLPEVRRLAAALGVADRCHFHGLQTDVRPYLCASDAFCLVSKWEGFPIATLEAMRAGRPTIVSRVGGAGEAVDDGVSGFVVERGDLSGLQAALEMMAGDDQQRVAMGRAARRKFEQEFSFEHMYQRTVEVYVDVAGRARA